MGFKFGIFDSFDQGNRDPGVVLRERVEFAVAAERAGIDHYHVTEHHGTPLSVCPSPNLFLAALAGRTSTMRMGALVYVLPTYHPLRLAEEIATLDQLTNGRLDLGIGGGISPYELSYFGVTPAERMTRYTSASAAILAALESGVYTVPGSGSGSEERVRLSILPVQRPYPPVWYASSNASSAGWAGSNAVNLVGRWNSGQMAEVADAYWAAVAEAGAAAAGGAGAGVAGADVAGPGAAGSLRVGPSATVVVGETDAEAHELFATAGAQYTADLLALWHEHDNTGLDQHFALTVMLEKGNAVVGSVESVTEGILHQVRSASITYFEATLMFGTMTLAQGTRNLELFAEVMRRVHAAYPEIRRGRAA